MPNLTPLQQRVYAEARAHGYDPEAAAVAVAVASSEGLGSTRRGDAGHASGIFQFYFGGGAGDAWAVDTGHTQSQLDADPFLGDNWWLEGSLGQAIQQARAMKLKGADLARVAGKIAEKPAEGNEQNYATNYAKIFGTADPSTWAIDTTNGAPPVAVNEPAIYDPVADSPTGPYPKGVDAPQPQLPTVQGSTETPESRAITAVAQATANQGQAVQAVSDALNPIAAIARFFTSILPNASGVWTGLEIVFFKLLASIVAAIVLIVGIIRATGTGPAIETAAKVAAVA